MTRAETILVDGQSRPTFNSLGERIDETEEGLVKFWKWFGASVVKDEEGRPLVVYHGTPDGNFSEFNTRNLDGRTLDFNSSLGAHFTEEEYVAQRFAGGLYGSGKNPLVHKVYLKVLNPVADGDYISREVVDADNRRFEVECAIYNSELREHEQRGFILRDLVELIDLHGIDHALQLDQEKRGPFPQAPRSPVRRNPLGESEIMEISVGVDYDSVHAMNPAKRKLLGVEAQENLVGAGKDAVFYANGNSDEGRGSHTWIVFDPTQIKATNNYGKWDPSDPRFLAGVETSEASYIDVGRPDMSRSIKKP